MASESKDDRGYVPKDKYRLVYIVLFMCGLGGLLPWNFFINAQRYFDYKMRNKSLPNTADYSNPNIMTPSQVLFGSFIAVCSLVPFALMSVANLFLMKWFKSNLRFIVGSVVVFLVFLATVIIVPIDVSADAFLGLTLFSVVLLNCGSALVQSSVFSTAAVLPSESMKAVLEGQAVSGVLASVASIISIAAASTPTASGMAYFLIALIFIAVSTVLFLMLPKNSYFRYYWKGRASANPNEGEPSIQRQHSESLEPIVDRQPIGVLASMRETILPGFCVLLTLLVTLSIFPAVASRIRPMNVIPGDKWTNIYFVPVLIFLSYNICDWCGRTLGGFVKWPRRNQMRLVLALCILRFILIPFCMFCNAQPRYHLPVLFKHDVFPALMVIILGLTNGYLMTIAMMHGPTFASPGNHESAGAALCIYLALGLSSGVALSVGFVKAV
uniref:Equilibrative nucleoside transporter 3 n=1 Tax=Trichobilharzia regenti TaxID=157069 RepID=A0AA85JL45_TRIRE|nr:unnamed protein product [Trichobilharzia regenti]